MENVFIGLGVLCVCIIIFALFLLVKGDGSRDQKLMQYFLMGSLVQNAGYLLELMAPTMEAALVAVKIQYLGSLVVPISYCYFMFSYCYEKTPEKTLRFLKIVDIIVLVLVFTCDLHDLYYRQTKWLYTADGHGYLSLSYGPGYAVFMLCGSMIPYAMTLYALIRVCIRKPEYVADRKYRLVLFLSMLPVVALCSYSLKLTQGYDPTPFVLGVILASVVILIWSRRVYDFSSLAAESLLDSMGDGVIALDDQERIVNFNRAAALIFPGLSARMVGRQIRGLEGFPEEIVGDIKEEFCYNSRFYQYHAEPIQNQYGKMMGYVVLILDVTDTRNYIEEIKRVREQAEQANVAKSAFLANMSHEIRTPMNAIVGLSDIIVEESKGRKVYEYARDVKASAENLLALINDILDLSKVEAGKMKLSLSKYHLKTLVGGVLNMMDVVASQRGILLESEYDMSIPCRYLGDGDRIKQVLINILNNALKFTKEGHVKLSVAGRKGDTDDTEWLMFRIEDTGCGIRQENLEKIFDNFRQVDSRRNRSVEGTGLGLAISRQLVELMQGRITVESVYGEGSVFTVEIPQKIVDQRSLLEVPEAEVFKVKELDPFWVEDYKVLVVDDNRINRKVARIFLQSYGLKIDEAESGPEAIELVRQTCYDIIFMDHMMPGMDGIEAVQIIRQECGANGVHPVIIALTANAMTGVREKFLENGFQDFITKPLDRRPLHEALKKWIPTERQRESRIWIDRWHRNHGRQEEFQNIVIEGIDTDEVVRRYSGGVEEYLELLSLYCLDGRRKLVVLRELWENRDYKTYGIEVHALKSASANVGAMRVSENAKEHEKAVNRGDEAFVDDHIFDLLADYEKQLEVIQKFLKKHQDAGRDKEKADEIEKDDLLRELREAAENLENFRSRECADKVEKILEYRLREDMETKLEEISEQLKLYEDDAAEQMLRELIEQIEREE